MASCALRPEKRVSSSRRATVLARAISVRFFHHRVSLSGTKRTAPPSQHPAPVNRNTELLDAFLRSKEDLQKAA
jgi:hypothetical protein